MLEKLNIGTLGNDTPACNKYTVRIFHSGSTKMGHKIGFWCIMSTIVNCLNVRHGDHINY